MAITEDPRNAMVAKCGTPKPKPVSVIILEQAERLAIRTEALAGDLIQKNEPVMRGEPLATAEKGSGLETYPPYFHSLRTQFDLMNKALDAIQSVIDRTEL